MVNRRRGLYLLPNLLTTGAMFAGFYAIVAGINSNFEAAAIAIFIAMILDGMDGRVARLTNTQSDFGMQYDSLSDMVSFGLAPALVIYQWSLSGLGKLGWLGAFVYAAAAALRLARFNTQASTADKRYFQGLPSPPAAALIAGMVWCGEYFSIDGVASFTLFAFPTTMLAGILMVSNIRYHSFKRFDLKGRKPFVAGLVIVMIFVLIASEPPLVLFLLALIYAVSGPVLTLIYIRRHRAARKSQEKQQVADDVN
ncbi:MAG: CDP-diacylglycerol--serine O-phosphatidyltransferase [Gammaproteobacteria bacterium]|nr:CDP-diacylglycerol--serine O-phosphatidyltransferase [Gammaproteobacteria bacterium]NIN62918.1 CDP-diacylglycerol--serine O-phosphatidyltransferase [Gammaproteobacteria bacterium]NIO63899.1 CDP-diacylglycerol--serine O-phosphatidyltransferase [Gammaproteobacteria bacterium]NIP50277.1 CDP-diacylglycerol--serine O-phosphatidyltransferase [Gammaproteobacteria bacterium]NIQ12497.1 CDP-diacylglycerol--serine O-phosphatidyltransferase [Gammaproteobacteria bacterium]